VPTQALFLMNSEEITRLSDRFAARVIDAGEREVERIRAAFSIAFGRAPSPSEIAACRDFLDDFRKATEKDRAKDRANGNGTGSASNDRGNTQPRNLRDAARQRVADRMNQRRGAAPASANAIPAETAAYSALCQALFLSGEFRTLD
jgi:hypothetical protein